MADKKPKLLIVEDDAGLQAQLKWAYDDFEVVLAGDRDSALAALRAEAPQVVTLDLGLPPDPDGTSEGFAVLDAIMQLKPDTKVIVASGHGARESALQAIERGAYDFYQKPLDIDALGLIVRRAFALREIEEENRRLVASASADKTVLGRMITGAPEMVKVARTIERVAKTSVSVMLLGAIMARTEAELPRPPPAPVPLVAAAADLKFALDEIIARFERDTGQRVRVTYGSSGNLARQISQSAPYELFLSADEALIVDLHKRGHTRGHGELYGIGRIVLFVPAGSSLRADP
ncbi:MAG: molybdate ABC transporter substrate-binding protein, partial [Porphyrobacter sp.]|nr:molybdate ABC transporter substrate-binding protein [Porphyrobacter sp.]